MMLALVMVLAPFMVLASVIVLARVMVLAVSCPLGAGHTAYCPKGAKDEVTRPEGPSARLLVFITKKEEKLEITVKRKLFLPVTIFNFKNKPKL